MNKGQVSLETLMVFAIGILILSLILTQVNAIKITGENFIAKKIQKIYTLIYTTQQVILIRITLQMKNALYYLIILLVKSLKYIFLLHNISHNLNQFYFCI